MQKTGLLQRREVDVVFNKLKKVAKIQKSAAFSFWQFLIPYTPIIISVKIFCKEKDFYDYVGEDSEDVVFDRRNFTMYEKSLKDPWMKYNEHPKYDEKDLAVTVKRNTGIASIPILALNTGNNVYAFQVTENYALEYIGMRKCWEIKFESPLQFHRLETLPFNAYTSKEWIRRWKSKKKDFEIEAFFKDNPANWIFTPLFDKSGFPILKNTSFPKYLDAREVYFAIEEWLISQHNDVDQESIGLTDVDKIINHGFDKKTSFRSAK